MDTPGPFETKATEAYYYVTPVEPDWPPKQKEEWLTAFQLLYDRCGPRFMRLNPGPLRFSFLCLNASPAKKAGKNLRELCLQ